MIESDLLHQIQLSFGVGDTRLFRNNVGVLQDERGNYVRYGLAVGSGDLIGWRKHVIVPRDVGSEVAIFTSIEVKSPTGRVSHAQQAFIGAVLTAGGIAGVARSIADAHKLLRY